MININWLELLKKSGVLQYYFSLIIFLKYNLYNAYSHNIGLYAIFIFSNWIIIIKSLFVYKLKKEDKFN